MPVTTRPGSPVLATVRATTGLVLAMLDVLQLADRVLLVLPEDLHLPTASLPLVRDTRASKIPARLHAIFLRL